MEQMTSLGPISPSGLSQCPVWKDHTYCPGGTWSRLPASLLRNRFRYPDGGWSKDLKIASFQTNAHASEKSKARLLFLEMLLRHCNWGLNFWQQFLFFLQSLLLNLWLVIRLSPVAVHFQPSPSAPPPSSHTSVLAQQMTEVGYTISSDIARGQLSIFLCCFDSL